MRIAAFLALWAGLVGALAAQPRQLTPGSVLLFPTVDSRQGQGKGTVISVTNTNASRVVSPTNNLRAGDVQLHYYYVAGSTCAVFDRKALLTPNDTLTVLAGTHNPELTRGWLIVVAEDPETGKAIDFDYLLGKEIVVDVAQNRLWSVPAIPFRGLYNGGNKDNNGRYFTDANGNGSVDFDGTEYDAFPDQLMVASFFEQTNTMEGELILVSPLGGSYRVDVDFLIYDNEEDVYSRDFRFTCWTSELLVNISKVTQNLRGTSKEPATGWIFIDGDYAIHTLTGKLWRGENASSPNYDPPLVGAFVERVKPSAGFEFGTLLHQTGSQNGNEWPPVLTDD